MRGKVAKELRRAAAFERAQEQNVTATGWYTDKRGTTQLSPWSIRALAQKLKDKYARVRAGLSPMTAAEERSAGVRRKPEAKKTTRRQPRPLIQRKASLVQKPLMLILEYCQPTVKTDAIGQQIVVPHPLWKQARIAADRGNGKLVRQIAAQFA
jgi:hypothetical protein